MYQKHIHDATTGEIKIIELTEHQFRCERLGLPETTSEEVVNATWIAYRKSLEDEQTAEITRAEKVKLALEGLRAVDMGNVQTALDKVQDANARLLIGRLIQIVRLLVIETLQGDD